MPKKTKKDEAQSIEAVVAPVAVEMSEAPSVVERTKKSVVRSKVKPAKRMNFARYARTQGFKTTHIPGLKARAGNPNIPRTLEEWNKLFQDY